MGIRYDEDTGQRYYYDDESGSITPVFQYEDSYVPYSQIPEYERMRMEGWMPGGFYDPATADWKNITGGDGIKFPSEQAYLEYLYGPGVEYKTGADGQKYYKAPGDIIPGRTPYTYNPPDSAMTRIMPMIIGGMAFPGLAAGLGGGALGAAGAGALIGGTTSAIGGGDFLKGALTGALGGGLTSGLSGVSNFLQSAEGLGLSKSAADAVVSAGARAISAGATGQDVDQAILGSLLSSGAGGAIGGTGIDPNLAKLVAPVISTALLGGDVQGQLLKSGLSYLGGAFKQLGETADKTNVAELPASYWNMVASANPNNLPVFGSLNDASEFYDSEDDNDPYEGLEGYTPELIRQLYAGTYDGPEQTEAELRAQLGDFYDLIYPSATGVSSWAGGYDLPGGGDLMPSSAVWTGGYDLPGGGDIFGSEWTSGYDLPGGGDLPEPGWTSGYDLPGGGDTPINYGGTGSTGSSSGVAGSGGTGATGRTGTKITPAGSVDYGKLMGSIQNIFNTQEPNYPSPIKPFLAPTTIGGTSERAAEPVTDYSKIIGALASLTGKGMKEGGSTHIFGPEGKLYEKHHEQGFAVGGPGTGQSDDIPTMLSDGEFVIPADVVSHLGDGSSKAGADALYKMMEEIRKRDRSTPSDKLPPKAKNPLAYLKEAQKAKG